MISILLIPAYAFLFRLRGTTATDKLLPGEKITPMTDLKGFLGKPGIFFIMSVLATGLLFLSGPQAWYVIFAFFVAHLGFSFLQYLPEFGKYFPFSNKNTSIEPGIAAVDDLANWSTGSEYSALSSWEFGIKWRTHGMCWRWVLLSIPKYAAIAIILSSPWPLLAIPAAGAVGIIYLKTFHPKKAEWWTGGYLGLIEALIIILT